MKKFAFKIVLAIALLFVLTLALFACGDHGITLPDEDETYTIQYTDASGTHSITVEDGMPYSIESIPLKDGYEFTGLFDAESGGTKYISAQGASLSVFTDKKNMVLFPQFAPKEYAFVLDYQGAAVTGIRQFKADYDAEISDLPTNLVKEHAVFAGWYTEPECGGTQVADAYGLIPMVSVVKKENFDLTQATITLYAGFTPETYTVTFYNANGESEEVKVGYNTPIKQVVPDFRQDGKAPLSWSKSQSGEEIFTGKVTADMILYVAEWAPVLEFDAAGGKDVVPLVAKAGSTISLPTPTRKNYTFAGWYTTGGVAFSATVMPEDSMNLVARWNAQLIFDTRGGTDVGIISEAKGTAITLPTTEKADYIFAGWYTDAGEKYETKAMPEDSLKLYAKYYKVEKKEYVMITDSISQSAGTGDPSMAYSKELDLSELYQAGVRDATITVHYTITSPWETSMEKTGNSIMRWYYQKAASDAYLVWKYTNVMSKGKTQTFTNTSKIQLKGPSLYVCFTGPYTESWGSVDKRSGIKGLWVEVEYPDMTNLC